jgi:hypothetical protein
MSILDALAADAGHEQQQAAERERQADQAGEADRVYLEAWVAVGKYAGIRPPEGKDPSAFYSEAEEALRRLAVVIVGRGWDKYLPAVAQDIEQGRSNIDQRFRPGETAVAELLRLALDNATPAGTIARELQRLAERERRSCGLAAEVDNVRFAFLQCVQNQSPPASMEAPALPTPPPQIAPPPKVLATTKRLKANELMILELEKNPEAKGWTVTQWQAAIGRSRDSIHKAEQWTQLEAAKKVARAERAMRQDKLRGLNRRGIDRRRQGRNLD